MYDHAYYGRPAPRGVVPREVAVQIAQERDAVLQELQRARTALRQSEQERQRLSKQMEETLNSATQRYHDAFRALSEELERARIQAAQPQADVSALQEQLDALQSERERLCEEHAQRQAHLEGEIAALREELAARDAEVVVTTPQPSAVVALRDEERGELMVSFLPLRDNLERALSMAQDANNPWRVGLEGLLMQLDLILGQHGLRRFGERGEAFDPHVHEAISVVEDEHLPSGKLHHVERVGFIYEPTGRVVRAAQVCVTRGGRVEEVASQRADEAECGGETREVHETTREDVNAEERDEIQEPV